VTFRELAGREGYPPGRELVVRELSRALYGVGGVEQLCIGARVAIRYMRSLGPMVDPSNRDRLAALDAACAADELVRMARVAGAGLGRG
jgi:hypothetical protein